MREIKFSYIQQHSETGIFSESILTIEQIEGLQSGIVYKGYTLVARRQFTGLRDKNGKEVYEGDVLEFDRYEWYRSFGRSRADIEAEPAHYFVVRWEQGGWAVDGCISEVGTYCEVVGNIYQHPHLLEAL